MTVVHTGDVRSLAYKRQVGADWKIGEPIGKVHTYEMFAMERVNPNYSSRKGFMTELAYAPQTYWYTTRQRNLVNNQINAKFSALVENLQLLADLGEGRGTIDMIQTNLKRILKGVKAMKQLPRTLLNFKGIKAGEIVWKPKRKRGKGPRKNRKKTPRDEQLSKVPAAWLEFNFAVQPFIGSVKGFIDEFEREFDYEQIRFIIRSNVIHSEIGPIRFTQTYLSTVVSAWCTFKNPNALLVQRLGLTDVIGTAWELFPWSWAIDYFTGFGDYLSNFSGKFDNLVILNGRKTTKMRTYGHIKGRNYDWEPNTEIGEGTRLTREPFVQVPPVTIDLGMDVNLRQCSYLSSAIALTLKGKMS